MVENVISGRGTALVVAGIVSGCANERMESEKVSMALFSPRPSFFMGCSVNEVFMSASTFVHCQINGCGLCQVRKKLGGEETVSRRLL